MTIAGIVLSAQLLCLTQTVYYEDRQKHSDGWHPQLRVAAVVHNRMLDDRFPDTYCDVVKQPYQFSYQSLGSFDMPNVEARERAFRAAYAIWSTAKYGRKEKLLGGVMYFHADWIDKPYWTATMNLETQAGQHLFYSSGEE